MDIIEHQLADRGKRLGGALVDGIIAVIVILPIMYVAGVFDQIQEGQQMSIAQTVVFFFVGLAVYLAINGVLLAKHGQTVGKKVAGTRIVSKETGKIIPLGKIVALRILPFSLINQIPVVGSILGLVNVLFIFRQDKRCIHDLIAGTVVVDA